MKLVRRLNRNLEEEERRRKKMEEEEEEMFDYFGSPSGNSYLKNTPDDNLLTPSELFPENRESVYTAPYYVTGGFLLPGSLGCSMFRETGQNSDW